MARSETAQELKQLVEKWREQSADEAEAANREHYGNCGVTPEFVAAVRAFARENSPYANELEAALALVGAETPQPLSEHEDTEARRRNPGPSRHGYRVRPLDGSQEKQQAGNLKTSEATPLQIDCPFCGITVKQVASATLSLALWQHVNWVCQLVRSDMPRVESLQQVQRRLHIGAAAALEFVALTNDRNELLAALKDVRAMVIGEHGASSWENVNGERSDTAIAKAERESPPVGAPPPQETET